jgi:hypothetical protein
VNGTTRTLTVSLSRAPLIPAVNMAGNRANKKASSAKPPSAPASPGATAPRSPLSGKLQQSPRLPTPPPPPAPSAAEPAATSAATSSSGATSDGSNVAKDGAAFDKKKGTTAADDIDWGSLIKKLVGLMAEGKLDACAATKTLFTEFQKAANDDVKLSNSYFSQRVTLLRKAGRSVHKAARRLQIDLDKVSKSEIVCLIGEEDVRAALKSVKQSEDDGDFVRNLLKIAWPKATARATDGPTKATAAGAAEDVDADDRPANKRKAMARATDAVVDVEAAVPPAKKYKPVAVAATSSSSSSLGSSGSGGVMMELAFGQLSSMLQEVQQDVLSLAERVRVLEEWRQQESERLESEEEEGDSDDSE